MVNKPACFYDVHSLSFSLDSIYNSIRLRLPQASKRKKYSKRIDDAAAISHDCCHRDGIRRGGEEGEAFLEQKISGGPRLVWSEEIRLSSLECNQGVRTRALHVSVDRCCHVPLPVGK